MESQRFLVGVLSVMVAALSFVPPSQSAPVAAPPRVRATLVPVTPPPATPVPAFRPLRITMPTLGVDAPVVPVGIDPDGAMGTPSNGRDVAWWDGRLAGQDNALLAGHKDWRKQRGSFYSIGQMKPGDPVQLIGENGAALAFRVQWVRQVPGNANDVADILGEIGHPAVTLITCGGEFDRRVRHYQDRIVVRAVLA